jgi:hypothetical protein
VAVLTAPEGESAAPIKTPLAGATRVGRAVVLIILVAAVVATLGTKWLWGYWFVPPALDPRVRDVAEIIGVSDLSLRYAPDAHLSAHGPFGASEHEFLPGEITKHVSDRGVAPPDTHGLLARRTPRVAPERLAEYTVALDPGVIGNRLGRTGTHSLYGEMMEFRARDGHEYAFISVVSSPPWPATHTARLCCEFLLGRPPDGPPRMLSTRRFYFGEGELASYGWAKIFWTCAAVLAWLAVTIVAIQQLRTWIRIRRHRRVRGFAVEPVSHVR